jgi:hypothetical protein
MAPLSKTRPKWLPGQAYALHDGLGSARNGVGVSGVTALTDHSVRRIEDATNRIETALESVVAPAHVATP